MEAATRNPFTIAVQNHNPADVLVGLRVHVGASSSSSIPQHLRVAGRTIPCEEGVRRWYDLPLTAAEVSDLFH